MLQKNKRRAVDLPAKPKFTKAEIIDAAYEIALKGDLSLVTAREVGKALGTSSSPIFTVFENMEQLKAAVWQKALTEFYSRLARAETGDLPYRNVGVETVKTAVEQPNLFRMLFVNKRPSSCDELTVVGENHALTHIYELIANSYDISAEQAKLIHDQVWFYTFGLAMHCVNQPLSEDDIKTLLSLQFRSVLSFVKAGKEKEILK